MRYSFRTYPVDLQRRELRGAQGPVPLEPKVFDVLAYLVQHAERLVTKEELLEHIWPEVYLDDRAIARTMATLRRAVGDSASQQHTIQTRHRQGYRFVAPVRLQEGTLRNASPPLAAAATQEHLSPGGERKVVTVLCGLLTPRVAASLDPECWYESMAPLESVIRHTVSPYGGTLLPMPGERLTVVFGAPLAQEDHAMRAVRAALALRQHWPACITRAGWPEAAGEALRLGLHTAMVVVGTRPALAAEDLTDVRPDAALSPLADPLATPLASDAGGRASSAAPAGGHTAHSPGSLG